MCNELHARLYILDGSSLLAQNMVAGQVEEKLRQTFQSAYQHPGPAVIFLDELEVLCPARDSASTSSTSSARFVAQLLSLMDGVDTASNRPSSNHVLIVGATNHPNLLDNALRRPGRFDRELKLMPPDVEERYLILQYYTQNITHEEYRW